MYLLPLLGYPFFSLRSERKWNCSWFSMENDKSGYNYSFVCDANLTRMPEKQYTPK